MFNIALSSRHEQSSLSLELIAMPGADNARNVRHSISNRAAFTSILLASDAVPRAHGATLFNNTCETVLCELKRLHCHDGESFFQRGYLHDLGALPEPVFVLEFNSRVEEHCHIWVLDAWRDADPWTLKLHDMSQREVRTIERHLRLAVAQVAVTVAATFEADAALAEVFRRRCGLSRNDARGYLADYTAQFTVI